VQLSEGLVIAERFRLVRPLGQGGMGAVWRAHHLTLDIPCAIKFILGEIATAADIRARFEREARSAAQLRSPHVVQMLDHGVHQGMPYIAMELLEGEDLENRLRRLGRIAPRELVTIMVQVARALTKAHAAGLTHRDLKPANIFLARDGDEEIVKILDFGIAKQTGPGMDSNTKSGALLGTASYMSPEQAQGIKAVDHRSDLWSMAVVVYQCLTGRLPFHSQALGDLLVRILVNPLPVPSQIAPVPPGFDAWWAHAAAREPAKRFQSAKELVEALAAVVDASECVSTGIEPPPSATLPSAADASAHSPAPVRCNGASWEELTPAPSGLSGPAPLSLVTPSPVRRTGLLLAAALAMVAIAGVTTVLAMQSENAAIVNRASSEPMATTPLATQQPPKIAASTEAPEVHAAPLAPPNSGAPRSSAALPPRLAVPPAPPAGIGKLPPSDPSKPVAKPSKRRHDDGI
jgi:serine/threonine protein kinase